MASKDSSTKSTSRELPHDSPPTTTPREASLHPGASIMESNDPATDALRCWGADKQTHYPGQDGSIAVNGNSVDAMAWGGPITFPRKGDTLPPPDERARVGKFGHGDVKYVGPSEGEADGDAREGVNGEGKKKRRFSRLFRRKEKGGDGKGWSEGGDVVR